MIYHWCPADDWDGATDEYAPTGFTQDGFVHCSFRHQVERTAAALDPNRSDLLLLCIDEAGLHVLVEDCYDAGEQFPHVYESIPVTSVVRVLPFPPEPGGGFRLPPDTP